MPHKILIIEEDDTIRELLRAELASSAPWEIAARKNFEEERNFLAESGCDVLLLETGRNFAARRLQLQELRESGFCAPIILLSDAEGDSESLLGNSGANDYVAKPFRISVLLARIKAQLRQYEQSEDASFAIGSYILKPGQKVLLDSGQERIRLTEKEAAILKYLYQAAPDSVERETLLEEVWGYNSGITTHTLETHIYRLRQKIEADPANAQILLTVTGGGYKLAL